MIDIDSDQGRIGELWWINSNPSTMIEVEPFHARFVRWGTAGLGRNIRIALEPFIPYD
jgi:hypothetical protein